MQRIGLYTQAILSSLLSPGLLSLGLLSLPRAQAQPLPALPSASRALAATPAPTGLLELPDAPVLQQSPAAPSTGQVPAATVRGFVTDARGDLLIGARVTLVNEQSREQQTLVSDSAGTFEFPSLTAGTYRLTIAAKGFSPFVGPEMQITPGIIRDLPPVTLQIAAANTEVEVNFTQYEIAEQQVHAQEQQRVLSVIPNFYTSYVWNAAPLTPAQKFRLALRTSIDPVAFAGAGFIAGIEQSQNTFGGYGQGAAGYGKRFAAAYGDGLIGSLIGGALLPAVLRQDPRYFYKGTGTIRSRALYAISTVVICKGDNGRWQPNYSGILGSLASAGISNTYYPAKDRDGAATTIGNALIGTASGAIGALFQEFLLHRISRGDPSGPAGEPSMQGQH